MALASAILVPATIWAMVSASVELLTNTVPRVGSAVERKYQDMVSGIEKYDGTGMIPHGNGSVEKQVIGAGIDLYTILSGDDRFRDQVSLLVQRHGDAIRMLSPTRQAWMFCTTYPDRCTALLRYIVSHDMDAKASQ
jgi:hypothetical protein